MTARNSGGEYLGGTELLQPVSGEEKSWDTGS
jgi:hypothetical protein